MDRRMFLGTFDPASNPDDQALVEGLRAHGYELGRNVIVESKSARSNPERLPDLATELVQLKVDVLVTTLTAPTLAAQAATKTTPIVMVGVADPVEAGLVVSLAHPGGNITGMSVNTGGGGIGSPSMMPSRFRPPPGGSPGT